MSGTKDIIEKLGNSLIQHGQFNDRIYLMKLDREDYPEIITNLNNLASNKGYTKIFAKVPAWAKEEFLANGFREEGCVPGFYQGEEAAYFLGKYFNDSRKVSKDQAEIEKIIKVAKGKAEEELTGQLGQDYSIRVAGLADVEEMAKLYKQVFETYPFPIHDPNYLLETMEDNVVYFAVIHQDKIVALASSEMDIKAQNVEMTDFATLPDYLGNGYAVFLLQEMEKEMTRREIKTAYTIARAISFGMNITFAKMGYKYSGTLINNTNISGKLESMNIWYKSLI